MSFAKEPLTIVLCLDHAFVSGGQAKVAFDSAIGLKAHRPIVFAAAGPVDDALTAAGVEVVCLGQSDLLGNPSRLAAAVQGTWNKPAAESSRGCSAVCRQSARSSTCMAGRRRCRPRLRCRSRGPVCRRSIQSTNIFSSARTAASTITSAATRAAWNRFRPPAGQRMRFPDYARKLWRNARLTLARDIAHLPQVFSDYIAISRFQVDVVGELLPAEVGCISSPIRSTCRTSGRSLRRRRATSSLSDVSRPRRGLCCLRRPPGAPASCRSISATVPPRRNCRRNIPRRGCSGGNPATPCARRSAPPARWSFPRPGTKASR